MESTYQLVRVFNKDNEAQGNHAAIVIADDKTKIEASHKHYDATTTCFITHKANAEYEVQCFNGNQEIQCCGHGLIAAAKTIFSNQGLPTISLNENITASHTIDDAGHDVVLLSLPRLSANHKTVPKWAGKVIDFDNEKLLPSNAAVSEENDGYLLLEFEPTLSLEIFHALKLDLKKICENTQRAVVVVQFDKENQYLYMRYFAPQYGVSEDIATGSVMRFVGDYIEKKFRVDRFDVSQCSSQGGFMKVECKAENIIITANACMESEV